MESRRFFLWLSWWTKLFVSKLGCTSAVWDEKWPDFGTRIQQKICSRGIWDSLRYSVDIVGFQSVELSFFRWKNAVMPLVSRGGLFIYVYILFSCMHLNKFRSSDRFFAFFGHLFKRWLLRSGNLTKIPDRYIPPWWIGLNIPHWKTKTLGRSLSSSYKHGSDLHGCTVSPIGSLPFK